MERGRENNFNFDKWNIKKEGARKSFRLSTQFFVSLSLFIHLHLYTLELNGAFAFLLKNEFTHWFIEA